MKVFAAPALLEVFARLELVVALVVSAEIRASVVAMTAPDFLALREVSLHRSWSARWVRHTQFRLRLAHNRQAYRPWSRRLAAAADSRTHSLDKEAAHCQCRFDRLTDCHLVPHSPRSRPAADSHPGLLRCPGTGAWIRLDRNRVAVDSHPGLARIPESAA